MVTSLSIMSPSRKKNIRYAKRKDKTSQEGQSNNTKLDCVLMQMLGLSNKEFRKMKREDYGLLRALIHTIDDFQGQMCAISKEMKTARKGRRRVLEIKCGRLK